MKKRYRLISFMIVSLFLVLTITGCNASDGYTTTTPFHPYTVVNGKKAPCDNDAIGYTCGSRYYWDDNGKTYACDTWGVWNGCDPSHPVTPPITQPVCVPNYAYDNLADQGQAWEVISRQENANPSTSPAQEAFIAKTSKTVTVSDELDLTASASANADIAIASITASVKAKINFKVTQTVDTTIGNADTVSVPAGETAYANYGVKVQITNGHLYDKAGCSGGKTDYGTDITYVPIDSGWCIWFSNQPATLCPSV